MIQYNRQDALLTATVTVPAANSQTVTSEQVIDAGFPGSIDEAQMVVETPAFSSAGEIAVTLLSSDSPDGEFSETALSFVLENAKSCEYRHRLPLDARRYLKLQVSTSDPAPGSPFDVKMTLRV